MSFGPITPARIAFDADATPTAPDFGDVYHARAGALAQARHVFLGGNGLPARWAGRSRFVVLETGFGLGHNFLATWDAWRRDAQRCERLVFVSVEKHPPTRDDLRRALAPALASGSSVADLAQALLAAWPPLTPDLHVLDFAQGRVRLLLVLADIAQALPALQLQADALYLDGFAPARNPAMWSARALQPLARLAAPGATLATWSVAREVRDTLADLGFTVEKAPGFGGKREMTVARYTPRFVPPLPPGRQPLAWPAGRAPQVAVIGAGLAGSAAARALADQGAEVLVFERRAQPADATSGNAGGLFHGTVHHDDGPHARWLRAAALQAQRRLQPLIDGGAVPGAMGLLRGERQLDAAAMQALIAAQCLPADWVQAWAPATVAQRLGLPATTPAWCYPGGGWVSPAALVRCLLDHDGIALHTGLTVAAVAASDARWRLLDDQGRLLAEADAVVLANATDAQRLAGTALPVRRERGQVTLLPAGLAGAPTLPLALADGGYALRLTDGRLLCGATAQRDDDEPALRPADQAHNLATLQRLTGWTPPPDLPLAGRVAWRLHGGDRLPLVGAVPMAPTTRHTQVRQVERRAGLMLLTALGSRGITHAPLAGELLAAQLLGAPWPVPTALADALDPARFAVRAARQGQDGLSRS